MTTVSNQPSELSPYVYPPLPPLDEAYTDGIYSWWWPAADESVRARAGYYLISEIFEKINPTTSPEDFDRLLEKYPSYEPLQATKNGSALSLALQHKNIPLALHLINKFPYLVNSTKVGLTPTFLEVVSLNDLALLKTFIAKGANVALGCLYGKTALFMSSCDPEKLEMTKYLLRCKAVIYLTKHLILTKDQEANIEAAMARIRIENAGIELVRTGEIGAPLLDSLPGEIRDKICNLIDHTT